MPCLTGMKPYSGFKRVTKPTFLKSKKQNPLCQFFYRPARKKGSPIVFSGLVFHFLYPNFTNLFFHLVSRFFTLRVFVPRTRMNDCTDPGVAVVSIQNDTAFFRFCFFLFLVLHVVPVQAEWADEPSAVHFQLSPNARYATYERLDSPGLILFDLYSSGNARLELFNIRGERVAVLLDRDLEAGAHSAVWSGNDQNGWPAPSGIYFYRLIHGNRQSAQRLLLIQ